MSYSPDELNFFWLKHTRDDTPTHLVEARFCARIHPILSAEVAFYCLDSVPTLSFSLDQLISGPQDFVDLSDM